MEVLLPRYYRRVNYQCGEKQGHVDDGICEQAAAVVFVGAEAEGEEDEARAEEHCR